MLSYAATLAGSLLQQRLPWIASKAATCSFVLQPLQAASATISKLPGEGGFPSHPAPEKAEVTPLFCIATIAGSLLRQYLP